MTSTLSQKHPRGLYVLFFAEIGGMGLEAAEAAAVYGLYTSAVYLLTLPGGWLADNILGQKKAI
eukprot:gene6839-8723_t